MSNEFRVKMGVVVGNCGYYSKASGKKWVTLTKIKKPLTLKNQPHVMPYSGEDVTRSGLLRTKA